MSRTLLRTARTTIFTKSTPFSSPITRKMATYGNPCETASVQDKAAPAGDFSQYNIKNSTINTAAGVKLAERQSILVGSVLDLFEGNPTLKHLSLWHRDATFVDPITIAKGYDKFAAQWYGLPAVFNPIKIQSHKVTSSGNPIEMEVSNTYTVKGIKKEQTIDSIINIFVGSDGKIEKVEDKWNGKLPDGAVSSAFRKLNAVTVPTLIKVPKTEEEDMKMKADREKTS
ncbi:hypothetical protein BJ878DRAFT_301586 [Calycina marina]|uniref:SnoaL-like domain-containing protein n=1 Tax=Calycina marina TaxID=1763456 RepID=A0A9P7YW26_9HELO|nr:hypothetical protein BJ878DRAFT_301586 [Calycina marina]